MSSIDISELDDECIIFDGCIGKEGYGRKGRNGKVYNAHRLVWIDAHGDPGALVVDHICRNRACININHLRLLTRTENIAIGIKHNSLKTHCPQEHEYDYVYPDGRRGCRTCMRARGLAYYHRQKGHHAQH